MRAMKTARLEHGNGVMRVPAFPVGRVVRRVRMNGCEMMDCGLGVVDRQGEMRLA